MATEEQREIRYLQEQVEYIGSAYDILVELEGRIDSIEESLRRIDDVFVNVLKENANSIKEICGILREWGGILRQLATVQTRAPGPSPFDELFKNAFSPAAKKKPPRKPKTPKFTIVSNPPDDDGPSAA
jgi:hypothetical protein